MNSNRDRLIRQFLSSCDLNHAEIEPLAQDASFRRYFRILQHNRSYILMDAPPAKEKIEPFIIIAKHLAKLHLKAPAILDFDIEHGFILLEDFGDSTFTRLLSADHDEVTLYNLALDTLITLHKNPKAKDIDVPAYSSEVLIEEALLFTDWYLPYKTGNPISRHDRDSYISCWGSIFSSLPAVQDTLVLRDYHVDNLMKLGNGQCGLLDFQDALIGPGAYDLMSLLEDARRDVDPELKQQLLNRYFDAFTQLDRDIFLRWFSVLGAQRHCKVLGIFARLSVRDGKHHYLGHLSRVGALLRSHLDNEDLKPLNLWLGKHGIQFDS